MHPAARNRNDRGRPRTPPRRQDSSFVSNHQPEEMLATVLDRLGPSIMRDILARYRGLLREEDARDLLAITAVRAWSAWGRFDPAKGSLAAWIRTIAVHVTANELACGFLKCRCCERNIDLASLRALQDGGPGFGDDETRNGEPMGEEPPTACLYRALEEIIEALPPAQREILMADAASPDEKADANTLAGELGLSPASIRVYRMRAKQAVRIEWKRRGLPMLGGEGRGEGL